MTRASFGRLAQGLGHEAGVLGPESGALQAGTKTGHVASCRVRVAAVSWRIALFVGVLLAVLGP
jgi:hypothetical protein